MTFKAINKLVETMISVLKISSFPIDVEEIAKRRGLKVVPYPLEAGVSGILQIQGDSGTIGYNANEGNARRRFTIAHELGHYELHKDEEHNLFVDKGFKVMFRSSNPSTNHSDSVYEQEANAFAAALLMPESLLTAAIENKSIDLGSDGTIKDLADQFEVSEAAMYYRLLNLGKL